MSKSLKKYFEELTVTDDFNIAVQETKHYLHNNGFQCAKGHGYILAIQIKTGKTIAIVIEKSTRERTLLNLRSSGATHKVILLRDIGITKFIDGVEVIPVKMKDPYLEEWEKEQAAKTPTKQKQVVIPQSRGIDHVMKTFYNSGVGLAKFFFDNRLYIPSYKTFSDKMRIKNPDLCDVLGEELINMITWDAHKEARRHIDDYKRYGMLKKKLRFLAYDGAPYMEQHEHLSLLAKEKRERVNNFYRGAI